MSGKTIGPAWLLEGLGAKSPPDPSPLDFIDFPGPILGYLTAARIATTAGLVRRSSSHLGAAKDAHLAYHQGRNDRKQCAGHWQR